MCRLDGRDDTKLEKTFLIRGLDDLGVLYAMANLMGLTGVKVVRAGCFQGGFEGIDCVAVSTVSNGVNVDLIAMGSPGSS